MTGQCEGGTELGEQPRVHIDLDADVVGEPHSLRLRLRKRSLSAPVRELIEEVLR